MTANDNEPRWTAKITYRYDDGLASRLFGVEEIYELHDIVEAGPSFYSIISIEIIPGDRCPKVTVEEGARA